MKNLTSADLTVSCLLKTGFFVAKLGKTVKNFALGSQVLKCPESPALPVSITVYRTKKKKKYWGMRETGVGSLVHLSLAWSLVTQLWVAKCVFPYALADFLTRYPTTSCAGVLSGLWSQ